MPLRFRSPFVICVFCLFSAPAISLHAQAPISPVLPWKNKALPVEARIDNLVSLLTLDDKINLLSLKGNLSTAPIERLGIPSMAMADAPNGVRDGQSTSFPLGVTVASTWDLPLVRRMGEAIGEETSAKGKDGIYGPCVNIHRTPQGGRNMESYSEDPFLASRLAVQYIEGVQSRGVAACVKHFACNNQEVQRHSINVKVSERALREIYLPAFEASIREAKCLTVMSAFNKINGSFASESTDLIASRLKGQWGFTGFVVSDWGAIHDTVLAMQAGTDLELPVPDRYGPGPIKDALAQKKITTAQIDEKMRRLFRVMFKTGQLDGVKPRNPKAIDTPGHRQIARQVAQEGMVLLKNQASMLPLNAKTLKSIAVFGPNAATNQLGGRWSADVQPFTSISPLDGIKSHVGKNVRVDYLMGMPAAPQHFDTIPSSSLIPTNAAAGETGLSGEYFNDEKPGGTPVFRRTDSQIDFNWGQGSPDAKVHVDHFSARWTGSLKAPATGIYHLALNSDDGSRVYLDGKLLIDYWSGHSSADAKTAAVHLDAGKSYPIVVEYFEGSGDASMRLSWAPPTNGPDPFAEVKALAAKSQVAIVVVGLNNNIEGEELDPTSLNLPAGQDELIQAVASANKNTIVVLNNGTPIDTTSWTESVPAILEEWYAGEEAGNALADVLFGDINPSGKLPDTIAYRRQDYSDYPYYPGDGTNVIYSEGIYVGYRHFEHANIKPRYPFGYGLSYTQFRYGQLSSPARMHTDGKISVSVPVRNVGRRSGAEIVQVYVSDLHPPIDRPKKELKGFARVTLAPGQSSLATITLDATSFRYFDTTSGNWKVHPGRYEILVGASSSDIKDRRIIQLL